MLVCVVRGKAEAEPEGCAASLWNFDVEKVVGEVVKLMLLLLEVVVAEQEEVIMGLEVVLDWPWCA